ncbi:MAG TPA: penicillin acylase family protein, partial [Acidimicrobiia bacterium]|nr:penicillin acylase family protein [Acidimicrobiia bacterium]
MRNGTRRGAITVTLGFVLVAGAVLPSAALQAPVAHGDRAFYILPPGNYGGLPTTANSLDQLALYDGLTPLRGNVTDAAIARSFLPENFKPVGATHVEVTGHPGTTILYDAYGIPHITGLTRADLAFGAGWVTARDRGLLLQVARGPARVAVADIPGIDAFGLVTSGQSFVPSAQTEQLVTNQQKLLVSTYGDKGRQILADAQAEADGMNAYLTAHHRKLPTVTVNDVIAVTAFIGSIFGAGGGAEASNAEFLSKLENHLGVTEGRQAWEDAMLLDDPEAPTTTTHQFKYGPTGGPVTGSVTIDEGSIVSLDPTRPAFGAHAAAQSSKTLGAPPYTASTYPAAGPVPHKLMSNFLVVNPTRSATGNTLAVMGPQLGYYYPEIVEQEQLSGPGIEAQGVAVPGLSMYMLI